MTALALSVSPWRRWWRVARHRLRRRRGGIVKPWNALVLISFLVLLDMATKNLMTTTFPWHAQPKSWLIGPVIIILIVAPLLTSERLSRSAAFTISGALGNGLSVAIWGAAANPFMYASGDDITAFNLADTYFVVGFTLAMYSTAQILVSIARRHA